MEYTGEKRPFSGGVDSWLPEEQFLKIHLELTLLTNLKGLSWEDSEEIAGECLTALWIEYERTGFPYPIKPFLSARMENFVQEYHRRIQLQRESETLYLSNRKTEVISDRNHYKRLTLIRDELLLFLEPVEQAVLQSLLLFGMDLPAIAESLNYPLSKVRKHYKHGILRVQKHLGLWKKV